MKHLISLISVLVAVPAIAAPTAMMIGGRMTNSSGNTLYVFDKDVAGSGKSACNEACARMWPPMKATDADKPEGDWTVVTRDDGTKQWANKGRPLYFYSADQKAGEATGDNYKDMWHVIK